MTRHHKKKSRFIGIVFPMVAICTLVLLIWRADLSKAAAQVNTTDARTYKILRDSFLTRGYSAQIKSPIGRLTLLILEKGAEQPVRFDHSFHSNDKFRIRVTSSRDGYLYILHRAPGGKSQVLWPREMSDNKQQFAIQSKIRNGENRDIPPEPGFFIFDLETGKEVFYITISSGTEPPPFPQEATIADEAISSSSEEQLVADKNPKFEVLVRGNKEDTPTRGVIFDPGIKDYDTSIYFSAKPGEEAEFIMFTFMLNHE